MPQTEDLLRRGWHFWNQYTRVGFENALRCFEEAAGLDGADFRAFEGISRSYLILAGFLMRAPRDAYEPFLDAHHRAATLCGLTPELRLDRAFGRCVFEQDLTQAEHELLALRTERPSSVDLYIRLALVYLAGGRLQEASSLLPQAEARDALSPELSFLGIVVRLFAREFDAAVQCGKNAVNLHPSSHVGRAFYAEALDSAGFTEQALAQYRLAAALSPDTGWIRADQARCLAVHGQRGEASAILDGLLRDRETEYVDGYHLGLLLEALGRRKKALGEMERAYEEMSYALMFSALDPKADGIRDDARFAHLCHRVFAAAS
jgi:tetratricopeptide (TPR) repeat protein